MLTASNQAWIFLSTVYAGFLIGFLYDCCRMIRKMIRAGVVVTGILDLLFWSIIGMLSYLVVFYVNDGNVRLYTIAGFFIGWILYALTLSPFIMKALDWIYRTLAKLINWTVNVILWPFSMLGKAALRSLKWLKERIKQGEPKVRNKIRSFIRKTVKKQGNKKEF